MASVALLQGCSTAPIKQTQQAEPEAPIPAKVADRQFSVETLYALLVAEMAIDRKRYDIALNNYVQQAATTRDPDVTARATQIARILKAHQPALEMAQLWVDLEPYNTDAQLIASAELIEANRLDEAMALSERLLADGNPTAFDAIAVKAAEGDIEQSRALAQLYESLAGKHPDNYQLQLGLSVLFQHDNRNEEALVAVHRALQIQPNNVRAGFQETRILQQMGKQDLALEKLAELVKENPDNFGLRARYARILSAYDLNASREQFEILLNQAPTDPEILFSLALIENESGRLEQAESHFLSLLRRGYYISSAHFHLGTIYEKRNQRDLALEHYLEVEPGQNYLGAMVNATELMVNSNEELQALKLLRDQREVVGPGYREGLFILESEILATAGQMKDAENILSQGLEEFPQSTRLLYSRAMLYSRIDYLAAAEQDLKLILSIAPNNAAALNALGYTLADRTDRIDEAYLYIKKALELTPDDPAVMDSMGWVLYRRGNFDQALVQLRKAMVAMPDHEIAAHLGEVLWVSGIEQEARDVWREGLKLNPQSAVIRETIDRLNADFQ